MNGVEIALSRGLVALVDEADAEIVLAGPKWFAYRKQHSFYAMRNVRRTDGTRTTQQLHRFLTGWPLVDHANGDGLDNRRANLRQATQGQNMQNRRMQSTNTSGFKGVSRDSRRGGWQSKIGFNNRTLPLGRYADPEDAARAYDAAAREYYGAFARLNFPREGERSAR